MNTAVAPIRVFLVDAHRIALWGLERLLESARPRLAVVGAAASAAEALGRVREATPDVIVLAIGGEGDTDAVAALSVACGAKVLVLTGNRDETLRDRAVLAGARGVVPTDAAPDLLLTAIDRVHAGQVWLDRAATGRGFVALSRRSAPGAGPEQARIAALTERERAIIAAVLESPGACARKLAESLHIAEHTLRNHFTSIYGKLQVANRMELFAYAQRHGLAARKR